MSVMKGIPASFTIPAAILRYGDLVLRERPVHKDDLFSRRHPRMTRLNRAKIFAPFAALVGFEECVRGKEIRYTAKRELDADEEWELNHKLYELHCLAANSRLVRANPVRVSVEYFELCADPENEAYQTKGLYKTITGIVLKVDHPTQTITILAEGEERSIPFSDIYRIMVVSGKMDPG